MFTQRGVIGVAILLAVLGGRSAQIRAQQPSYCATGGPQLWANLEACGWPGPANTGYPAGTTLTNTAGRIVTTSNTVINGERISGQLIIRAANVTVKNSYISWDGGGVSGRGVIQIDPGASATIDHVEINGLNHTHACVWHSGTSMTATAVNCYGVNDGMFSWAQSSSPGSGDNVNVSNSYFHNFTTNAANGHIDGYQTEGAAHGSISHNTFNMPGNATSAISIWNSLKTSDDWTIQDNLLTGGGFTLYAEDYTGSGNTSAAENVANSAVGGYSVTNIRYIANKFSTSAFPHTTADTNACVGEWGTWFYRGGWPSYYGGPTDLWNQGGSVRSGNVVLETGANIDRGGPTGCEGANTSPAATAPPPSTTAPAPATNVRVVRTSTSSGGSSGGSSSSWPDASNTGYKNAPGYPGSLTTYSKTAIAGVACSGPITSGKTYSFCNFTDGLGVGSAASPVSNVTFFGCRFASNAVADANVALYGDNVIFDYSTFEPSADTAPPTAYNQGYQYGIDQRYNGKFTVDHSDFWGWGNGIQFGYSTQAKPFVVRNTWFHDARDDGGGVDHTDAILSNNGGKSYMVFDHNTIASRGNTQGLALQTEPGDAGYSHVTITNNYFSGFGYTIAIGEDRVGDTYITFSGNTFGTDFKPVWGVLYDADNWTSSQGNVWRNNKWRVVSGSYYTPTTDDGKYWWPDGSKKDTDYGG